MRVEFLPEALDELEARRQWWRANRSERDLFDDELATAVKTLEERATALPVVEIVGGRRIQRLLMPKTRCHLYFEVAGNVVSIVSAWGATMGRPPPL